MDCFDIYILTRLVIEEHGNVTAENVGVTFDIHNAETHRDADVAHDFQIFSVSADWREDAEQSKLVEAMRDLRAIVRQWQQEALR